MPKQINSIGRFAALAAVFALSGCRANVNAPEGRLAETTLEIDEAMQIRDWEPAIAYYQNPRFIAGPTWFLYQQEYGQYPWLYALAETPMFVAQSLALPVTLSLTPPWTRVEYAGETVPSTHHGMPPMPPPPREPVADPEPDAPAPMTPPIDEPQAPGEVTPSPTDDVAPEFAVPTQPTRGTQGALPPADEPRTVAPGATGPDVRPAPQLPVGDPDEDEPRLGADRQEPRRATPIGPRATPVRPTTRPATQPARGLNK